MLFCRYLVIPSFQSQVSGNKVRTRDPEGGGAGAATETASNLASIGPPKLCAANAGNRDWKKLIGPASVNVSKCSTNNLKKQYKLLFT